MIKAITINYPIRTALLSDQVAITALIQKSVRVLALTDYSSEQIEGALKSAWGLDTRLIIDQSYFVVEDNNKIISHSDGLLPYWLDSTK